MFLLFCCETYSAADAVGLATLGSNWRGTRGENTCWIRRSFDDKLGTGARVGVVICL